MNTEKRPPKVRQRARMSAPKLGEYLDTRQANRRERIIYEQKFPSDFIVARYKDALNAVRAALVSGDDIGNRLREKADAVRSLAATTRYQRETRNCCVEAIAAFGVAWLGLLPPDVRCSLVGASGLALPIEGVEVTVHPTVLLRRTRADGSLETGALQLVFRKEASLEKQGGQAAAEVLRRALIASGRTDVAPSLCIVLDVFGEKAFAAPTRNTVLWRNVMSACREIAVRWNSLSMRKSS